MEYQFKQLYKKHWSELYAYTFNIVRDKDLAEDIVQDVFTDYWDRMEKIDIENPRAFLYQSVKNQSAKRLKSRKFNNVQVEALTDLLPLIENETDYVKLRESLLQEIDAHAHKILPEKCLSIFKLRFYKGMSYKEIAVQLNISENTVENQISRALKLLRKSLSYPLGLLLVLILK